MDEASRATHGEGWADCHDSGQLAAIDWELSTIGDPLIDLGWLLATWPDEHGENLSGVTVNPWQGFSAQYELVQRALKSSTEGMDRGLGFRDR
jgi:aminoglycoside phosphotransferase (APT) family kinase protein